MFYIVFAIFLFMTSVMGHIFFCRKTKKPGLHAKAFIFMAMISLAIYGIAVMTPLMSSLLDPHTLWGLPFKITAAIIFILSVPVYLCFYVLTQLMSPSKKILLTIARQGESSFSEILGSIHQEDFIMTRLRDLCASGCVVETDGRYTLTSEGQRLALILNIMQGILGRNAGG